MKKKEKNKKKKRKKKKKREQELKEELFISYHRGAILLTEKTKCMLTLSTYQRTYEPFYPTTELRLTSQPKDI